MVYEEDRKAYYEALRRCDEEEDIRPLSAFLKAETVKTWARALSDEGPQDRKGLSTFL